jgi:hypothetical protein
VPSLLGGVLDVGNFELGMESKPAVLVDLDAIDGEPFLARTTDGALKIGTAEVRGNAGHVDGLLFLVGVRRRFILSISRIIFVNSP